MPALARTDLSASIIWLGRVPDREASLAACAVDRLEAGFGGVAGEAHSGETRGACTRVRMLHPKGTTIRNVRQVSVLSAEELETIAARMGVASLDPALVGAQMLVRGIPDFSHVPPGSRLQTPAGTTLTVDMQNYPCKLPAPYIERAWPRAGARFKQAAEGLRGVTAWVEREGPLVVGDALSLFVPDQRAWRGQISCAAE